MLGDAAGRRVQLGGPGGGVVDSDAHWIHEITTAGTALPASSTGADRCKGTLMSGDVAGRRDAGVRGYGCSAARGSSRLLGAQLMAPSEHGLAPAPRRATPAPARSAAGRRRDGEALAWRLGHDTERATLGHPDDPGGRAISLRCRSRRDEDQSELVWGRRVATTSSRGAPCPPRTSQERESS